MERGGVIKLSEKLDWIPTKVDVERVDWEGREIVLDQVPAEFNKKKNLMRVDIDEVIKAEQKFIAEEHGIDPRELQVLWLLHADSRFFKGGYIEQKFRFNKMLFYLWKRMNKEGYENSFIHDEFKSARAGPIPIRLGKFLEDLEKNGIVKVRWAKRPGISLKCQLTKLGEKVAKSIWDKTPSDIKGIIRKTKEDLFLIDATQLKNKVHKEYPEYKRTYTVLDQE